MKPSDLQVARLCKECHDRYPWKAGALVMREKWEHLACLLRDALYLNEAWIEHLEAKRPVELGKCSMDELNRWIATKPKMTMADRDWLVMWVDSRSAEMYDSLIEIEDD
ncbi:MAG: hypothetical protein KAV87_53135 [Desulfobacteraceae bacterium]|nr:hypothetical protein [Desulfobacteraceae bacterium]